MPVRTKTGSWGSQEFVESTPKKSRQGNGKHSKYSATSRNSSRKKYRGQGK
jgi:hypothetical protein